MVNMSIVGKLYFYYNTSTKDNQRVNINTLVRNIGTAGKQRAKRRPALQRQV